MGQYIGVDWASKGWVAAELDEDDELTVGFYPTIWNLWHDRGDDAEQILVDIPIGLPTKERRQCDSKAKDCLEGLRSSVFWTPIRDAVYEDNIDSAKRTQEAVMDSSISNQAWAIVPRIREVDTFLRENWDDTEGVVRESHPEVCFRKLSEERLSTKLSDGGLEERRNLLNEILEDDWDDQITVVTEPSYARQSAEDDVLDAIILAITARRAADDRVNTLPENPPEDDEELPMEIVYPGA